MSGNFGAYLEDVILDHIFGKAAYTPAGSIFVALSLADPTNDGSGLLEPAEVDGYARVETVAADWEPASGGAIQNAEPIEFPEAIGDWGEITHFALFDDIEDPAPNMLAHGSITIPKAISTGETARFNAGDIDITLD